MLKTQRTISGWGKVLNLTFSGLRSAANQIKSSYQIKRMHKTKEQTVLHLTDGLI